MDATCTIQDSIHVFNLIHKYVSRILGTYQGSQAFHMFINYLLIIFRLWAYKQYARPHT